MARLHVFTAHILPSLAHPYEAAQFVEESFSWKGFFFTFFWTLYHRLWWHSLAVVVANIAVVECLKHGMIGHPGARILLLAINLTVGFYGNDWRRSSLARRGYLMADIVAGDSLLRAEQRFFEQYYPTRTAA